MTIASSVASRPRGNPAWRPGVSGNPGGRAKGCIDRIHKLQAARADLAGDFGPIDWAIAVVKRDHAELIRMGSNPALVTDDLRLRALAIVAPYLYRRMPQAVEVDAQVSVTVHQQVLEQLSDEELAVAHALVQKVEELKRTSPREVIEGFVAPVLVEASVESEDHE